MYGELDPYYITNGLQSAARNNGVLYRVGSCTSKFQQTYVGNSAWAFICADKILRENKINSGEIFFIPDETPLQNTFYDICINIRSKSFEL
jgi:3beta-hydroxy-delta5-steroid dehydrogenase / steroid delta-isomerase